LLPCHAIGCLSVVNQRHLSCTLAGVGCAGQFFIAALCSPFLLHLQCNHPPSYTCSRLPQVLSRPQRRRGALASAVAVLPAPVTDALLQVMIMRGGGKKTLESFYPNSSGNQTQTVKVRQIAIYATTTTRICSSAVPPRLPNAHPPPGRVRVP
jgi:hypothetical protein